MDGVITRHGFKFLNLKQETIEAILSHIDWAPVREAKSLRVWKSRFAYIEYPSNLTPDMKLRRL